MGKLSIKMTKVSVTDNTTQEVYECMSKAEEKAIHYNLSRLLSHVELAEHSVTIQITPMGSVQAIPLERGSKA